MKIHEYQAKAILARHGVPVPRGEVASSASEAAEIARRLGTSVVVVKAQIHAGGRGKGGGVKLAKSPEQAEKIAKSMIGMTLVTNQTGPEGRVVGRVLVEEGLQMQRELYVSIVLDRTAGKPVVMASAAGGMDIEEVAEKTPEKIVKVYIEPGVGIVPFEARQLLRVLRRPRELDTAAFAAAARVDLRLHDDNAGAEALGDVDGICGSKGHLAAGHGHAVSRKDRFRLILVDFHIGRKETPDANLRLFMTQQ